MVTSDLTKLKKWVRQELRKKRIAERQQEARSQRRPRIHVDLVALNEIYDCLEASAQDPNEWA